ncbi:MAG TPA: pyridoxal-phosphate dependent enzyme [Anaerolineae bacterium]|nr:pyridoxal-phosphate dependent enzyme [Anaerolineae bacterium]
MMLDRRLRFDPVLECPRCGTRLPVPVAQAQVGEAYQPLPAACPNCDFTMLDVRYDYDALRDSLPGLLRDRMFNMWRYLELLPVRDPASIVTMGEGGSPLIRLANLGVMLGRSRIFIKDERQGPTGSFKDRQASLAISVMKESGILECVVASTGNVAISYSAYCARAGIKLWAFLTSMVPAEKMREVALYGSEVVKVTGTYDQAKEVAATFAQHRGLYLDRGIRSIAARESMKTLAYEVSEQLALVDHSVHNGRRPLFRAPDWYIQSVSGGLGPLGAYKGFGELKRMGFTDRIPKFALIQVEGCAPMSRAFKAGKEVADVVSDPQTHIATLSTGNPGPAYALLRSMILEHDGTMDMVSDEDAFRAMHITAKMEGISVEPAAAVAFAGLFKLIEAGLIRPDEDVVVNCTGHTLPVTQELLGDEWALSFEMPTAPGPAAPLPQEGLLSALERLDKRVNRILIVDDNADARRLLRRIMQARGRYTLFEAADGRQALAMAAGERPDLILLDLMMPEMDGFQVLEALKQSESLRQIPVIVVTAKELTPLERQRLAGQADSLLQKGSFTDLDSLDDLVDALI